MNVTRIPIPHAANLYTIQNAGDLAIDYQVVDVKGLLRDDHYDKNLQRLLRDVQFETRAPVALLEHEGAPALAVAGGLGQLETRRRLMPHVVDLLIQPTVHRLELATLDPQNRAIAEAFLNWAVRSRFFTDRSLWSQGSSYFSKLPDRNMGSSNVDIYRGFTWHIVMLDDGRIALAVDVVSRFVDAGWISETATHVRTSLRGRNCLYQFGDQWFVVQIKALLDTPINAQQIWVGDKPVSLYQYVLDKAQRSGLPAVRNLDPTGPTLLYRTASEEDRFAPAALCKLIRPTSDPAVARMQRQTILDPPERFRRIDAVMRRYLTHLSLSGQRIILSQVPAAVTPTIFPIPAQRFGGGRVLEVTGAERHEGSEVVPITSFARRRGQVVRDGRFGPVNRMPLARQFILLPETLPRAINEDLCDRLEQAVSQISHQTYRPQRVLYRNKGALSLHKQMLALNDALARAGALSGYAMVVMPADANKDLHNYLKRSVWPHVQIQCASAAKVRTYYGMEADGFKPVDTRRLDSYVTNCAYGLMVVNRNWLWHLEDPLAYDVYVGIDVLHQMAGLTFVYQGGRRIHFANHPVKLKEKLSSKQVQSLVYDQLATDLRDLGLRAQGIVMHRDGRAYDSEVRGFNQAIADLKLGGLVAPDAVTGVVEIRKKSTGDIRIVQGKAVDSFRNPQVGTFLALSGREAVICTTGEPFSFPGSAKPLFVRIASGDLDLGRVAKDVFALSQLTFTSPDKCNRLPVTIKLADDFLEPIAGDADDEAAAFESDSDGADAAEEVAGSA